ncbi:MAG: hypothetical protein ACRCSG_06680 [Cellulosilyticaceae bacterium]
MKSNKKFDYYGTIETFLTFKNLDQSYKIFWLQSIVNEVIAGKTTITFEKQAINMLGEAWELIFMKNITLGRYDKIARILEEIDQKWQVEYNYKANEAVTFLEDTAYDDVQPLLLELYENTVFRLFETYYEKNVKKAKESEKNMLLQKLIDEDKHSLYKIDDSKKQIIINKEWCMWLKKNEKKVNAFIRDSLAYYLDKNASKR